MADRWPSALNGGSRVFITVCDWYGFRRLTPAPQPAVADWAERVTRLRRLTRGDERAAHKPLVLLYALGRFRRYGEAPVGFSQTGEDLARLLMESGAAAPRSMIIASLNSATSARMSVAGDPWADAANGALIPLWSQGGRDGLDDYRLSRWCRGCCGSDRVRADSACARSQD